jgi:hypothetical protein
MMSPGSYYPLIAEHTRYADDFSWMEIASIRAPAFMMAADYRQRCRLYLPQIYDRRGAAVPPVL